MPLLEAFLSKCSTGFHSFQTLLVGRLQLLALFPQTMAVILSSKCTYILMVKSLETTSVCSSLSGLCSPGCLWGTTIRRKDGVDPPGSIRSLHFHFFLLTKFSNSVFGHNP